MIVKQRKRIFPILILICLSFVMTGCDSAKERLQASVWRDNAEEYAIDYIEEKYGFTPKVKGSKSERQADWIGSNPSDETVVYMEYGGTEFCVLIDGEGDWEDIYADATDNYQMEEIKNAMYKEVFELVGEKPRDIRLELGKYNAVDNPDVKMEYDCMFHNYFDGSNLEDLTNERAFLCVVEIIGNPDLDEIEYAEKSPVFEENRRMYLMILTYESEEDYQTCHMETEEAACTDNFVYENAMYISDALMWEWGEAMSFDLSIGQYEDFYYMSIGQDAAEVTIYREDDPYSISTWNGHGAIHSAGFDRAYYVENVDTGLYIYYPKDNMPEPPSPYEDAEILLATSYIYEGKTDRSFHIDPSFDVSGEYIVYSDYYAKDTNEDYSFRFLYDEED